MDTFTVLGVLALFARIGSALYATGLVRAKNSAATSLRIVTDLCISVVAFWAIGAAILFQHHNQWLGIHGSLALGFHAEQSGIPVAMIFVRLAMLLTATGLAGGAMAERAKFMPICIASLVLAAFVLPVTGNWTWDGWLAHRGFVDLAGGSALHLAAGVFAAVAALNVGPRTGKFNRDKSPSEVAGHNLPLTSTGVVISLVGWIGYIAAASVLRVVSPKEGSVTGSAAMNVILSAAFAGLASMIVGKIKYGRPDVALTLAGVMGGLVAMCAGGAALFSWSAAIIGACAGVIVPLTIIVLNRRGRLDDPLGIAAIHGVGGAWGTVAAGVFVAVPVATSRSEQIFIQAIGIVVIAAFAAGVSAILFFALKLFTKLRLTNVEEVAGLDQVEHGIIAYPDFQQNSLNRDAPRNA